jgi:alpha-acetolactate decarboxylase
LITKNANGEVIAIDGKAFVKDVLQDLKAKMML